MGASASALRHRHYDLIVIGGGPGGQQAALQAATAGRSVLLIEQERRLGGECVRRGTIPSKTLRETAVTLAGFRRRSGGMIDFTVNTDSQLASLMVRKEEVVTAHETFIHHEAQRAGVELLHGRARFVGPKRIEVQLLDRERLSVEATFVVIATGSRPRTPAEVPVDHEHIFDSDSILSMSWLPESLTVLGAGVIASEYASIFAALGVRVTMVDRGARPMAFLDDELTARFLEDFASKGGRFVGGRQFSSVGVDGSKVLTRLDSGEALEAEKMLCALGRVANVASLQLEAAGLAVTERGLIEVDGFGRTKVAHIYAVGDVVGPPSLASSSMEQGRRAARHALGLELPTRAGLLPTGVYTIPEMSAVGLTEEQAKARGDVIVGRASFEVLTRAHISGASSGLLKLVTDAHTNKVLGVHVVGEGAAELVHLGQLAMMGQFDVDVFIDEVFNFPTLAEAYRVAALDVVRQRAEGALSLREVQRTSSAG